MKEPGASQGQSASELISKRIAELEDWPRECAQLAAVFSDRVEVRWLLLFGALVDYDQLDGDQRKNHSAGEVRED